MPTYTYGNDPNHYVEVPDPDRPNQTIRPAPGLVVSVKDHDTMAALPDVTTGGYGYVTFTSTAASVRVSTDGFLNYKVLRGEEALDAAIAGGLSTGVDLTAVNEALAGKADAEDPVFTGTVTLNGTPLPTQVVEANVPNARLIFPPAADPDADGAYEITVIPGEKALQLPTAKPATEQVVTVRSDGTQGAYSLASLTSAASSSTTPTGGGGSSVQAVARRILAGAAGQDRREVLAAHPAPPTVTVVAGSTSTITGAVRVPLKRKSASLIDTENDPNFDYPGARPGAVTVFSTDKGYASYLTGGSSQNRRDYWRLRTLFSGPRIDFIVQARGTSLSCRVWVDGMPHQIDFATTTTTAGSNYLVQVDFGAGALGDRIVELEVNDPTFGGAWVGPTDSLSRYRTPRAVMVGYGDSHTAGANGVKVGDTWLLTAARLLGCDPVNLGIGGSGFFASPGATFRDRVLTDIVPMKPDLVVFPGGYNDVSVSTAAAIGTEATAVYGLIRQNLPSAVIIPAGPFWQTQNIGASVKAQDDAQRAAAVTNNLPFISYIDPGNLYPTTPDWTAGTAYGAGDVVRSSNGVWKAVSAHTAGTTFATDQPTRWRSMAFVTGTGKSTALAGNGNADVIVSSDGIHATLTGHRLHGYFLATEIVRCLRDLAA